MAQAAARADIAVSGRVRFARSLVRQGLIDEYDLIVHPVALGTGLRLFEFPTPLAIDTDQMISRLSRVECVE